MIVWFCSSSTFCFQKNFVVVVGNNDSHIQTAYICLQDSFRSVSNPNKGSEQLRNKRRLETCSDFPLPLHLLHLISAQVTVDTAKNAQIEQRRARGRRRK